MRIIAEFAGKNKKAFIRYNRETKEYIVQFYKSGRHLVNADYFTTDKKDAIDTAGMETIFKNPLTRRETKAVKAEARIHKAIKKPFYKGVAEGMNDIAAQYGTNSGARKQKKKNPCENPAAVKVYERIEEIIARKGPGHRCDAECRAAGHLYRHKFSKRHNARIFGNRDGSLTIK